MALISWNELESPLPKNALCQVWLKLAQWHDFFITNIILTRQGWQIHSTTLFKNSGVDLSPLMCEDAQISLVKPAFHLFFFLWRYNDGCNCKISSSHTNFLENIEDIQWFDVDYGIYFTIETRFFISSPELKAQVSFSDQNLSVVRRCRHCCCCRKLFTFSSSSPEPLGQFQPNLAQNILGWRGFKFVQTKGPALFQGEIITK